MTTATQYDGLGRATAEWADSRATTTTPNATFTYSVPGNAPSAVTTSVLSDGGGPATSTTLYDAMLRVRQTQSPTPQGGRLVTDTLYDNRGWEAKVNTAWWDSANPPSASLAEVNGGIIPDSQVPNQTDTTYDGLGRPILAASKRDNVTQSETATVYDQAVSDTATSDGDGTITVPLNAAGQPFAGAPATETVTDALGRTIQLLQYTTLPTVTVTSSQATSSSPYTTTVTASGGATQATDYGFSIAGDQTTVTDEATLSGAAQTWTSTYNMLGQVQSRQDPDAGTTSGMAYDADGNLLQSTSSLGSTLSYTYDALDRKTAEYDAPTSAQAGGNELASWAYDNSNNAVASGPCGPNACSK